MDSRDQGAVIIAAMYQLNRKDGIWQVPSQTTPGRLHQVRTEGDGTCTCSDSSGGFTCKHIRAVRLVLERELGIAQAEPQIVPFEKKPQKRDHAAFNEAQAKEKGRFRELLHELCRRLPEREAKKRGRKPHSFKDSIFAMAMKVYGCKAARTSETDISDAHEKGFLTRKIPGAKACAFFESPVITPILRDLVRVSALPLVSVEKRFAVDSSGFGNTKHENWFDYKHG